MKRLLAVLSLIALVVMLAGCGETPEEKKQKLTEDAFRAAADYKFDAAADLFRQLGDLEPQSPMAYYGRGLIFEYQLQYYDALHVYMTLTNSNPDFVDAWGGLYRIYNHLGLYQDAADAASGFLEHDRQEAEGYILLAEAMLNVGEPGRVPALLDSAAARGADRNLLGLIRARAMLVENKRAEADSVYQVVINSNSESAAVASEAVLYLESLGLLDSAVVESQRAVKLSDEDLRQTLTHLQFLIKHHYFFQARQTIASLKALGLSDIVTSIMDAEYYVSRGEMTEAVQAADRIIISAGKTISSRMYEIDIRGRRGDELTVATDIEIVVAQMFQQDYDKDFIGMMNYLMTMKMATLLRDPVALPRLETVRPKLAARMDFQLIQMLLQLNSGRMKEFEESEKTILTYRARDPRWISGLADIYGDRLIRKYDRAAQLYTQALDSDQFYRPAFENEVAMYRRILQFDKAAALFSRYPQFADRYPELACLRGITLVEAGRPDSGMGIFVGAAGKVSGDYKLFEMMHHALRRAWAPDQMRSLVAWIEKRPTEDPDLEDIAASLSNDVNDYQKANALSQKGLGREPSNLDLRAQRARALNGLGETQAAIDLLEENLKTNSYHVLSNFWLSRILADERLEPDRAANLARRAVFDDANSVTSWVNLIHVYMQVGRFDLARGEAEKASHSYAGEPVPLFMYGKALYLDDRKDEAKKQLQAAIDHGLTGPDLQEANSLLKKL